MRRILVVSHVLPYPASAGQRQRVGLTLQGLREAFHVTFLTTVAPDEVRPTREALAAWCDEAIVASYAEGAAGLSGWWRRLATAFYCIWTGLRASNYFLERVAFPAGRWEELLGEREFDCVLLEYWHAAASMQYFRDRGIPVVLDTHNVLWQAYRADLDRRRWIPAWWKRRAVALYREAEEEAWRQFDGLIAINREEHLAMRRAAPRVRHFYTPMGVDVVNRWCYRWRPEGLRICCYGGFGSAHNTASALRCARQIMPMVWRRLPHAELWLVGSQPPAALRALETDARIRVTGFVDEVQPLLGSMQLVLCPWKGTYGFRSRLVEVMAVGVPVVANPDAVDGMEMAHEQGILLGDDDTALALHALRLLTDRPFAAQQSERARALVAARYGFEATYGALSRELSQWVSAHPSRDTERACNFS
ncbi:MAG: glycosyltransferase family 4 protein [Acidobacteriota bacterium]|jgi:glycosyltransferase involved in cell wall biosynthesis|nr:glycosyltransferase family 4 protein [Bryobacteraceae bacterium CoA2 C42]